LHEACGVFGIYAPDEDVARITYFALFALQHRGQESAGIATNDQGQIKLYARQGLVSQVFNEDILSNLNGYIAIGHNRYSTKGTSRSSNAQPILITQGKEPFAIAHNGNISNAEGLQQELAGHGYHFHTSTDTEVIGNLLASYPGEGWIERMRYAMGRLQGAYSMVILTPDSLIAVRDPLGTRPLSLGTINGHGWVVASETCALDHIGADFLSEINPGEMVIINKNGIKRYQIKPPQKALCAFEFIYFARPDSTFNSKLLYSTRQAMGRRLAQEYPVEADLVIGVPDSATVAASGYALESGIPQVEGLIKNRYVGRTFIQPDQRIRDLGVRLKFNPLKEVIEGKRLVVVDDSIVRGTTTPKVISLLRKAGAKEVHMRICSPPIEHPCFFGVDMATRWELIAAQKSVEEIRKFIGADSLGYLSLEGLVEAIGLPHQELCLACFNGKYPVPVQLEMDKFSLEGAVEQESELSEII
jgi:amidophosphoribosyltransferase